jgi:hypothetical protein
MNLSSDSEDFTNILVESFRLLYERPVIFIPKFVSTILGAVWTVGLLESYGNMTWYLVSFPFLAFISMFISVMIAGMVENQDSRDVLRKGFKRARSRVRTVLTGTLMVMFFSFMISLPLSLGLAYYYMTGTVAALLFGGLTTLAMVFAFSFIGYFLPIGMLDRDSALKGLLSSKNTAFENPSQVTALTLLSFALLALAFVSQGALETLGYLGFVIGRLMSAVVTTYVFVVSPNYYLQE